MLDYLRCLVRNSLVFKHFTETFKKMSKNGILGHVDPERCKRGNDDESVNELNKKLRTDSNGDIAVRLRKYKYALLLGYNGRNYHGMQLNKEISTIELQLMQAFLNAGYITEDEAKEPYRFKFQRAARTDKTVSAVRQVVSLLLPKEHKIDDINRHLPSDIRVFSIKRATKCFDSKNNCCYRTYSYVLPTYALSQEPLDKFLEVDYRISSELLDKVRSTLKLFIGTHNFHNFTAKKHFLDPSANRYIKTFDCSEPFIRNKEFVVLTVKGQSFMLHQIRKMVSAVLATVREIVPLEFVRTCFLKDKIRLPTAPGEPLFLEQPHFEKYDRKFGSDGFHEKLDWADVEEEVKKFKEEHIFSPIIEYELENQTMMKWLDMYIYNSDFDNFKKIDSNEKNEEEDSEISLEVSQ